MHETSFSIDNSWQLTETLFHIAEAYTAHSEAWKAGVLHRDVSDSNIVLIYDPVSEKLSFALLIAWDLSKEKKEIDERRSFDDNRLVRSPCHTFP